MSTIKNLEVLNDMFELAKDSKNASDIVIVCRQVLEKAIDYVFDVQNTKKPYNATLLELINYDIVKQYFNNDVLLDSLHFVRIVGNNALHQKHVKRTQAQVAYSNIEYLLSYLQDKINPTTIQVNKSTQVVSPTNWSEDKTRKVYIDLYLQEAGWEVIEPTSKYTLANGTKRTCGSILPGKACCEVPVQGVKNFSGVGFCDYVLYGNDGKPLAIVEAKKADVSAIVGQQQVKEYGECMKKQYGYVPILYCTNGYETIVIDGKYPQRKVNGFHTLNELSYLIKNREIQSISDMYINDNISGRPYQKIAITNICERFNKRYRKGLLVMATGTGKTRVSISLVDVLTRNNWAKNILFLADRTSLVAQAFKNFAKLLPDMTYRVLSDKSLADEPHARITFSTHQTMINYIDSEDKGEYTIGRFDLIIIDEAHRSIFNKYAAIFDYFDSLLIGLTATPKDDVDANTYKIFNCEEGQPNFAYSLEEAVRDHYLVPYKVVNKTTKLVQEGIKYKDLTIQEQLAVDLALEDTFDDSDVISGSKLFKKIYNKDTCKHVLEDVMKRGIKVDYGQKLGKTIIFAVNHKHAELIVDTFNEIYPAYGGEYCKLIDNQIKNSQQLIEEFEQKPEFRIAVSVDMLDTGIDVPAVVNLVFFKQVKSKIKFVQMIGRGTRLCPNLINGKDKDHFLIFDYCGNFDYFDKYPDGSDGYTSYSVTQKIFDLRLEMLVELQKYEHQIIPFEHDYYNELKDILIQQVKNIKKSSSKIAVKEQMKMVDKYCDANNWNALSPIHVKEITYSLTHLIDNEIKEHPYSLSFDLKMLRIEKALLTLGSIDTVTHIVKNIREIAKILLDIASIQDILDNADYLNELYKGDIWNDPTLEDIEYHRKKVRDLMKYIPHKPNYIAYTDTEDETIDLGYNGNTVIDIRTYKEKVIDYLYENINNPTIIKIKNMEPLNEDDFKELEDILWVQTGTKEDYYKLTNIKNLAIFIRAMVGIEQAAVNKKFGEFLNDNYLTAEQQEFIYTVINYARENGDIEPQTVITETPFNNYSIFDLFGEKATVVATVVNTIHNCIN